MCPTSPLCGENKLNENITIKHYSLSLSPSGQSKINTVLKQNNTK